MDLSGVVHLTRPTLSVSEVEGKKVLMNMGTVNSEK